MRVLRIGLMFGLPIGLLSMSRLQPVTFAMCWESPFRSVTLANYQVSLHHSHLDPGDLTLAHRDYCVHHH